MIQTIYDIVKAHGGDPDSYREKVESENGEGLPADLSDLNKVKAEASAQVGSVFSITLPNRVS